MRSLFQPNSLADDERLERIGQAWRPGFYGVLDVLVWNVYKGRKASFMPDFKGLSRAADLILLQETVSAPDMRGLLEARDGFEWHMARSYVLPRLGAPTGIKTGAAVSPDSVAWFRSPDAEPVTGTPKMMLLTRYPIAGSEAKLLAVNIHAVNFVSAEKFRRQIDQCAAAILGHRGPVILGGDFNAWSGAKRAHLSGLVGDLALTEVAFPRKPKLRHLGAHLDHIFYRDLGLMSARSHEGIKGSDHLPLTARFELP
jgi:endonuclease/exonuclease/phosphatase (EEP) superfamily protein YafD